MNMAGIYLKMYSLKFTKTPAVKKKVLHCVTPPGVCWCVICKHLYVVCVSRLEDVGGGGLVAAGGEGKHRGGAELPQ